MRLIDLDPIWVGAYDASTHDFRELEPFEMAIAQGIMFLCPVCFTKNNGPVGTETVLCWFKHCGIPDDAEPGPGRWDMSGTGFGDLTLAPSVNVGNEHWHGHLRNGEIVGGF